MAAHTVVPQVLLHHRLRIALEWAGVDPGDMATELGVHINSVHNYTSGRRAPKRQTLVVWSIKTGVPLNWLMYGDEDTTSITEGYLPGCPPELPFSELTAA